MFKALHQLAQDSPIALLLSAEGDNLRVTVTQKKSVGGPPLMLSVVGAPDELDADFAHAIAPAAVGVSDLVPVKEQVRAQLDSAKPTSKSKPAADAVDKQAAAKTAPAATTKEPNKTQRKQACLDEFVRLNREHLQAQGKGIGREAFIEKAETKRDFERLFGNWTKFKAAGEKASEKAAAAERENAGGAAVDDKTRSLLEDDAPDTATNVTPTASTAESSSVPDDWPFPTTPKDVELGHDKHTGVGLDLYDEEGVYLTSITTRPAVGEIVTITAGDREVVSIDARRVITKPAAALWHVVAPDGALLFEARGTDALQPGARVPHLEAEYVVVALDTETHRCVVRPKLRPVVLEDGTVIGSDPREVEAGDTITLHNIEHTVLSVEAARIVVQAPKPPPKVRNVVDDEGAKLGTYSMPATEALTEGEEITVDGRQFTVIGFTEKAVFVEPVVVAEGA
jgi:PRTRC genetic system protein E